MANNADTKGLAKRSFRAASWVLIFQFASQFAQILIGIYMARLLAPSDYGILGLLTIFWSVSHVFINGGFGQALLQRKEVTQTDLSSVFYYNLFLGLVCCALMIIAAPWIARFYHQPILQKTIMVSAWALPIGSLGAVQQVILGRELKQGFVTASRLIGIVVSGIIALYLAKLGYGVWALVWQSFIATACGTCFVFIFVRWIPHLEFSIKSLKSLFRFGSRLLIAGLIEALFVNINNIFIGKLYTPRILGYYEQARRYSTLWPLSIQGAISQVLFPAFSKIQDDLERLKKAFERALNVSVCAIVFPAYLLCTLSRPFIEIILTPKWLPCIPYMWLLTCSVVLYPIHVLNLQVLNSRGRSDLFLRLEIVKKLLAVVSVLVMFLWGIVPMLIASIAFSLMSAYLNSYYVGKDLGYTFLKQLNIYIPYVMLSVVSCVISHAVNSVVYMFSPWTGLILSALAGSASYCALNMFFCTAAYGEVRLLVISIFEDKNKISVG